MSVKAEYKISNTNWEYYQEFNKDEWQSGGIVDFGPPFGERNLDNDLSKYKSKNGFDKLLIAKSAVGALKKVDMTIDAYHCKQDDSGWTRKKF